MRRDREIKSSSLSFIDVMACGLGAVILLLIILDFNTSSESPNNKLNIEILKESINKKKIELEALNDSLENMKNELTSTSTKIEEKEKSIKIIQSKIKNEKEKINELKRKIKTKNKEQTIKIEKDPLTSILGLNVEGENILIALDVSKSMISRNLVDIYSSTSGNSEYVKFKQAKNIYTYLINNLKDNCKFTTAIYSEKSDFLKKSFLDCNNNDHKIEAIEFIAESVPSGGTDLSSLLSNIKKLSNAPTDIYLITDGLPTLSTSSQSLKSRKDCFNLRKKDFISGECRESLFIDTVGSFNSQYQKVKINIILLPLEGDPKSVFYYSRWANMSGGVMISPQKKWLN